MQSVEQLKYPGSNPSRQVALIQWKLLPHEVENAEAFAAVVGGGDGVLADELESVMSGAWIDLRPYWLRADAFDK